MRSSRHWEHLPGVCVCEDTGRRVDRAVLRKGHGCWSGTPVVAWSNRPLVCHLERCAKILGQHSLMVGDVVVTVCLDSCRTNWKNTIGERCFDRFRSRPLDTNTGKKERKLQTHTLRYCKSIGSSHFLSNFLVLVPCVCPSVAIPATSFWSFGFVVVATEGHEEISPVRWVSMACSRNVSEDTLQGTPARKSCLANAVVIAREDERMLFRSHCLQAIQFSDLGWITKETPTGTI